MTADILVWHRNDLRPSDNAALAGAAADGRAHPLFVFDPRFYRSHRVCDSRIAFLHECLEQLRAGYRDLGGDLALRHGDPQTVLGTLLDEGHVDRIYCNATVTAGYARERDRESTAWDEVTVFADDGIVRAGPSRADWQAQAEAYFDGECHEAPRTVGDTLASTADCESIEREYALEPTKDRLVRGGYRRARERLESFTRTIDDYVGGISAPAEAQERTSHLSAAFVFGCLSVREAMQYVEKHGRDGRGVAMFTERLYWNRHFTQKLADNPQLTSRAINPVFHGMNRSRHDPELVAAWREGRTGFPLVDASMRALHETGWLNFRMRAMCASFYSYVLGGWWKRGADWFYRHLIDADPAINYAQWQMQSGLVGVHPLRLYNPRKQVRDNDPEGEFIRAYVPELADLPAQYLPQPEKTPLSVQQRCGVRIGEDYPYPVVDFERRRKEARERWAALGDRAREALEDPAVRRRASLSGRHGDGSQDEDPRPNRAAGQASLEQFEG